MTKKQYVVALSLICSFSATGYAANPTTKEYVDTQVMILKSQIAAIPYMSLLDTIAYQIASSFLLRHVVCCFSWKKRMFCVKYLIHYMFKM